MSEMVSSLLNVALRGSHYILIVVNESKYDTPLQILLARQAAAFGESVGLKARVIRSYREASHTAYLQVQKKAWPAEIRDRICDPQAAMLIFIKSDFAAFNPQSDDWCIVWLSAFGNLRNAVPHFFDRMDRELRRNGDLFAFLRTKLDGKDRSFPTGSLSIRGCTDVRPIPRKKGREGILDPESGLTRELLRDLIAEFRIVPGRHGWRIELSRKAAARMKRDYKRQFAAKSICACLRDAGMLDELMQLVTRAKRAQ